MDHQPARRLPRHIVPEVGRHHRQREIDAGGNSGGCPDRAVAHENAVVLQLDRRIARPEVAAASPIRVSVDRNRVTGGGVTTGIDFALKLVSMLADQAPAETIQLRLEYDPAPPFNAGSPQTAPAAIVTRFKERAKAMGGQRGEANRRAAARLATQSQVPTAG